MNSEEQRKTLQADKTLEAWQTSSQYWEKYRDLIAQMFAPLTAALVHDAQIETAQKVLDIGGGSGEPSLTIAEIVGPNGSVMYTDPVAGMVQVAQTEASRRGLTNIQFRQCSGDQSSRAKGVVERRLKFAIEAPARAGLAYSFDQFWQMRTEMSDTLRQRLAGVTPDQLARIKPAVAEAAEKYFSNAAMSFPAEALIVSGRG